MEIFSSDYNKIYILQIQFTLLKLEITFTLCSVADSFSQ